MNQNKVEDDFERRETTLMKSSRPMLVCFKADKFNCKIIKDYFVNDCCFGDDLCSWLIAEFTAAGCKCDDKPQQEDFGWFFNLYPGKGKHRLVCGYQSETAYTDAHKGEGNWLVWIEHSKNFISSLLGGGHENIDFELLKLLHKILKDSTDVLEIRWFTKDDFDRGAESHPQDPPV